MKRLAVSLARSLVASITLSEFSSRRQRVQYLTIIVLMSLAGVALGRTDILHGMPSLSHVILPLGGVTLASSAIMAR